MTAQNSISIVIPIHNEQRVLRKNTLKIASEFNKRSNISYEILLVENGSIDGTYEIAKSLSENNKNIKIIKLKEADYGKALREGILKASNDYIVCFDLDFFDIDFALQALALEPFGYDVIVASKNLRLSKDYRSVLRKLISGLYKYILYYGFGLNVSDTHGIKALRNDKKLKRLTKKTINNKEIFDTELIIRSQYAGRKLLELPITIKETRKSVSKILPRSIRGLFQILKLRVTLKL